MATAVIQRDARLIKLSLEDRRKVLDVSLTGQFPCALEAMRHFRRRELGPDRFPVLRMIIFIKFVHQADP